MRIAQIAPLFESVPPANYGGTERIVSYLTEELVRLGHQVTLFASGDSKTSARLEPQCPASLRSEKTCHDTLVQHILMVERVFQRRGEFDLIHSHVDYLAYPMARQSPVPVLTTLHGRLDYSELIPLYKEFDEIHLISISNSQRKPIPWANWIGTVYHGLPKNMYRPEKNPGRHFLFLGRISPEKRPDRAIEIAKRAKIPLFIAAKVDAKDQEYFTHKIRPMLKDPLIHFLGEVSEREKGALLAGALALLFPIDWEEPFGLVMIESMACGTPVVAFDIGSVPEILEHGKTGFICRSLEEAVACAQKCSALDRRKIRAAFEERFTIERMTADYLALYQRQLARFGTQGVQIV